MKTMRFLALAAAVTALAGCSKLEPAKIENAGTGHEVYLAVRASSADTRTAISPDYAVRWAEGDAIGLFYDTAEIKAEQKVFGSTNFKGVLQNIKYWETKTGEAFHPSQEKALSSTNVMDRWLLVRFCVELDDG